jgi:hypothetical protein
MLILAPNALVLGLTLFCDAGHTHLARFPA